MRDIKYMALDVANKKVERDRILVIDDADGYIKWMQFTGFRDQQGNEIYEDFTVRIITKPKVEGTVVWERGAWMVDFGDKNDKFAFSRLLANWANECIITGNIHEQGS